MSRRFQSNLRELPKAISHGQVGLLTFAIVLVSSALGCGHTPEHEGAKAGKTAPFSQSPFAVTDQDASTGAADDKFAAPSDEEDEWVPMTGNEKVIADQIELLTDGAPVQIAPAERDATETTEGARPVEK